MYIIKDKSTDKPIGQTNELIDAIYLVCLFAKTGHATQHTGVVFAVGNTQWSFEVTTDEEHSLNIISTAIHTPGGSEHIIEDVDQMDVERCQMTYEQYKARCPNPKGQPPKQHGKTKTIQYRVSQDEHERIRALCLPGETANQCARRLLFDSIASKNT